MEESRSEMTTTRLQSWLWPPRPWFWKFVGPALLLLALIAGFRTACTSNDAGVPVVVVDRPTPIPTPQPFEPVHFLVRTDGTPALYVTPDPVVISLPAVLFNGICLDDPGPMQARVYLGLQSVTQNPLLGVKTQDLVGTDLQRLGIVLNQGCRSERIDVPAAPATLTPGRWVVVLKLTVMGPNGQVQNLTEQSEPFDIVAAP